MVKLLNFVGGCTIKIPYDLTYKWNLINKRNKQAKYNQKHGNKELTVTRGEVGGDNGAK